MAGEQAKLAAIGQVAVMVDDLGRATEFYRDALGLELLFSAPNMAFFRCGEVRLMLGIPERAELRGATSILYYRVGDIAAAHQALVARGVRFEGEPHPVHRAADHVLWLAFFRDSEGNLAALMSEVAMDGRSG